MIAPNNFHGKQGTTVTQQATRTERISITINMLHEEKSDYTHTKKTTPYRI